MLELKRDADYVVEDEHIAGLLGIPKAHIRSIYFLHHMAFEDGDLAVRATLYFDRDLTEGRRAETVQVELSGNEVRCCDLSSHAKPRQRIFDGSDWGSIPMGDKVLYFQGTSHAFLVSRGMEPVIQEVVIEHGIGDERINENVSATLRPGRGVHPVSDGNSAAISLSSGSSSEFLAVLTLDPSALRAYWSPFLTDDGSRHNSSIGLAAEELIRLSADDFPRTISPQPFTPLINEALIRNGRVYIYTKGHRDSPKYGYDCSDIAQIGPNGRVVSRPFAQDYTKTGDEKKYGMEGRFTSSGQYCVLSSVYDSTDPWKGKQRLFDMDKSELIEVVMPRGYTKFRIVDHAGDHFWADLHEGGKSASHRLASFCVV